jgi:hypothetical protein
MKFSIVKIQPKFYIYTMVQVGSQNYRKTIFKNYFDI